MVNCGTHNTSSTDDKNAAVPGTNAPTQEDKARIASTQDKAGKDTGKDTFTSRIQSAADKAAGDEEKKEAEKEMKYVEPE